MRRAAPGVAVVLSALVVLSVAGCGNSAGAVTTSEPEADAPAPVAKSAASGLAGLVVVPKGYLTGDATDPSEQSGPFSREYYGPDSGRRRRTAAPSPYQGSRTR